MSKPNAFLSTRQGHIDEITIYKYLFSERVLNEADRLSKLKKWLQYASGYDIYDIGKDHFWAFSKLPSDHQYTPHSSKTLKVTEKNTNQLSEFIAKLIKRELSNHYPIFLNYNAVIVDTIEINPFKLYKAVEFNIEVFPSGKYLIHFIPTSKIVSFNTPIKKEDIYNIRNRCQSNTIARDMEFSLIDMKRFRRTKIDLFDKNLSTIVEGLFTGDSAYLATFDYHFINSFSTDCFRKIKENTEKSLNKIIWLIDSVLNKVLLPDNFNLSDEKYYQVDITDFGGKKKLLVGAKPETITIHGRGMTRYGLRIEYTRDKLSKDELLTCFVKDEVLIEKLKTLELPKSLPACLLENEKLKNPRIQAIYTDPRNMHTPVSLQSGAYYHGVYKPVNGWRILPVIYGKINIDGLSNLFAQFNHHGKVEILDPIITDSVLNEREISDAIDYDRKKILVVIFCQNQMPRSFFDPLAKLKLKFQIYLRENVSDKEEWARLSNFTCKCIEKMGGIIATISDSLLPAGYYVGIDLGHTTHGKQRFSNLAGAIFSNKGRLIGNHVINNIPRKENLTEENLISLFQQLKIKAANQNLINPSKIIIHRDGKLHLNDSESILEAIRKIWGDVEVDIVEVIKSGFPIIVYKDESNKLSNLSSGDAFIDSENKYAILATNTQADEYNNLIRPIIIKHRCGNTDFTTIVEQVFWLTKIYTNNLYNSTRLPATTLKANNIAGTSNKIHQATYSG